MSGLCPSCEGRGYHYELPFDHSTNDDAIQVQCPDCAGTGKAENSITVNEQPDLTAELVEALEAAQLVLRDLDNVQMYGPADRVRDRSARALALTDAVLAKVKGETA